MALISCEECGEKISEKAESCPKCGAPTKAGKKAQKKARVAKRGNTQGVGCLLILLSVVLGLTVVGAPVAALLFIVGFVILIAGLLIPA
ncbi:zinc ribbon domain-containing protein [Desulfatibacillum aliphaticivorans]|uniref:zinc ribbon domain-containing protein n=1 Tax=Desulfatibacillum aliphaticivorans TaxID=218208 RepID=UPI0005C1FD98|nr:zinc ribbon domain-containing protein [Desulfatibacillum aliphaticivorans]